MVQMSQSEITWLACRLTPHLTVLLILILALFTLREVVCFHYGARLSFSHFMYFILPQMLVLYHK